MGSSAFAIPALAKLRDHGYQIAGVITQPDKPSGRGQSVQAPPLKTSALQMGLPVFQPSTLKDEAARALFESLAPDLIVVVAYGKILPRWLIQLPRFGCLNLHGSLLPKYRGAAPIHWAIAEGETVTGVCTMQMDEGLDTGPVLLCAESSIGHDETVKELSSRLAEMGADLTVRTVEGVVSGLLKPRPQNHELATVAPILKKHHGFIDWRSPAEAIHNRVRAFNPWPGAVTRFRGAVCKILRSRIAGPAPEGAAPGTIIMSGKSLTVVCGNSVLLEIAEVQPESRKPVTGGEFANGARIQTGEKFDLVMDN
jgi:methionyl-tRNA formyltransferase